MDGDLAEKHGLRGFEAIHLASAITLANGLKSPITFSSADQLLQAVAVAEQLQMP